MFFRELDLNILYKLFLDYLNFRYQIPLEFFISQMDMLQMQGRILTPFSHSGTVGFLGFIWSQPALTSHPNFESSIIFLMEQILLKMKKQGLEREAFENVINFDVPHQHYIYIALQLRYMSLIEFVGNVANKYFKKNVIYQFNYLKHLSQFKHLSLHVLSSYTIQEIYGLSSILSSFFKKIFVDLNEFDSYVIENLDDMLLGNIIFSKNWLDSHTVGLLSSLVIELLSIGLLDVKFINKHFLKVHDQNIRLLDQLILRGNDNPILLNQYLSFIESLYVRKFILREQYVDLVLKHMRSGFSPLHELVYHGCHQQLYVYLDFIQNALVKGYLYHQEVNAAINCKNTAGFSLVAQACNNHKASITKLFFDFCQKFYSAEDFLKLLKVNKRFLKCSNAKNEFKEINLLIMEYRKILADYESSELGISMDKVGFMDLSFLNEEQEVIHEPAKTYLDISFFDEKPEGHVKFEFSLSSPQENERIVEKRSIHKFFDNNNSSPTAVWELGVRAKV